MMKLLLLLVVLTLGADENTNDGYGFPCKASTFKQFTKCKGKDWVNGEDEDMADGTTRAQCCSNCQAKGYEYFGWNSDKTFCRCYGCSKGPKQTSQKDYPGTQYRNLLFKVHGDAGKCQDTTESGSACDMHVAQEGTRCVSDSDCEGEMQCCENYKVCGDKASGTQIAVDGKAYNSASGKWDLTINWDTWACSEVGSEMQVAVASAADCGMPIWAYGMFALLTLNPIVLLWTRSQKGDQYTNLLEDSQ